MVGHMMKIAPSEITPEHVYLNRRQFMVGVGSAAGALALSACVSPNLTPAAPAAAPAVDIPLSDLPAALAATEPVAGSDTDELGDPLNSFEDITNFNNYYEFSTDKQAVARLSQDFVTRPWTVEVGGLVNNPRTYDIDDLLRRFTQEERIYRLRCVEAWSMVVPWVGFSLAELLKEVEPTSAAKYVHFTTVMRPDQMPGLRSRVLDWPYVEGLRLDEAMHDLTLLSTGLYGKVLVPANGAPLRLVVPWKYGFKSIKGIVKIDLVEEMPVSSWMAAAGNEYGFYANVNPEVNHPRWSQATERRIGESGRRETLMFNGYADEVAHLYADMDLRVNY
jgi:methionine sulfoxide reductase catalytic subunit